MENIYKTINKINSRLLVLSFFVINKIEMIIIFPFDDSFMVKSKLIFYMNTKYSIIEMFKWKYDGFSSQITYLF